LIFGRKIHCGFSDGLLSDRLHQKTRRANKVLVIKVKAIFVSGKYNIVRSGIKSSDQPQSQSKSKSPQDRETSGGGLAELSIPDRKEAVSQAKDIPDV